MLSYNYTGLNEKELIYAFVVSQSRKDDPQNKR